MSHPNQLEMSQSSRFGSVTGDVHYHEPERTQSTRDYQQGH